MSETTIKPLQSPIEKYPQPPFSKIPDPPYFRTGHILKKKAFNIAAKRFFVIPL